MLISGSSAHSSSRARGVGRNVQTIGLLNCITRIHRRMTRINSTWLIPRASREYGQGKTSGENTWRLGASWRNPRVLVHQR